MGKKSTIWVGLSSGEEGRIARCWLEREVLDNSMGYKGSILLSNTSLFHHETWRVAREEDDWRFKLP